MDFKNLTKINALNFEIVAVSRLYIKIFFLRYRFNALTEKRLIFGSPDQNILGYQIPRDKKIEYFSQGTNESKPFRCETLYNADYEHVNTSSFAVLDIKLCLEEEGD